MHPDTKMDVKKEERKRDGKYSQTSFFSRQPLLLHLSPFYTVVKMNLIFNLSLIIY